MNVSKSIRCSLTFFRHEECRSAKLPRSVSLKRKIPTLHPRAQRLTLRQLDLETPKFLRPAGTLRNLPRAFTPLKVNEDDEQDESYFDCSPSALGLGTRAGRAVRTRPGMYKVLWQERGIGAVRIRNLTGSPAKATEGEQH